MAPAANREPTTGPVVWILAVLAIVLTLFGCFHEALLGQAAIDGAAYLPYGDRVFGLPPLRPNPPVAPVQTDQAPQDQQQPWDVLTMRAFHLGELPLWQPHNGLGYPLLANIQAAPLNPLKLMLWDGGPLGQSCFLVSRLLVAALGALVLANRLCLGPLAGVLAGLGFALSGYVAYHFQYPEVHAAVLLPWVVWAGDRLAERLTAQRVALTGLLIGLTGLMGHPEAALWVAYAATATYGAAVVARRKRSLSATVAWAGVALLAVGLDSVLLLPFWELLQNGESYVFSRDASAHGNIFLGWTFPASWQDLARHMLSSEVDLPYFFNGYVGAVTLALAPVGLWRPGVRTVPLALLGAAAVGFLVAHPGSLAPSPSLMPPAYFCTSLVTLALAIAGAAGLQRFVAGTLPFDRWMVAFGALTAAGLAYVVMSVDRGAVATAPTSGYLRFAMTALIFGLLASWAALCRGRGPVGRVVGILAIGLLAVDLGCAMREAVPPMPIFAFPAPRVLATVLRHPGLFRVAGGGVFAPNINAIYGLDSIEISEPLLLARYLSFYAALNGVNLRTEHPATTTTLWLGQRFNEDLLDLANVRYLFIRDAQKQTALAQRIEKSPFRYRKIDQQPGVKLYESQTVLPRARVLYGADFHTAGAWASASARLGAGKKRWRDRALIETPNGAVPDGWQDSALAPTPALHYESTGLAVAIDANARAPGWLVLAEAYYPGWQAFVDGKETEIFAADVAFRAIRMPRGLHHVTFRYRPRSVTYGVSLSIITLLFALALTFRRPSPGLKETEWV